MSGRARLVVAAVSAAASVGLPAVMAAVIGVTMLMLLSGGVTEPAVAEDCGTGLPIVGQIGALAYPIADGQYTLTSPYGPRWGTFHFGQDFGAPLGTEILASGGGVVREAGPASGFGEWIVIDHTVDGQLVSTVYGHMYADGVFVDAGDTVATGQVIGEVGSNGQSTGPHLHFEVWEGGRFDGGAAVDPMPWLTEDPGGGGSAPIVGDPGAPPASELLPYPVTAPQSTLTITPERETNTRTIIGVGKGVGLPWRAMVIALATAAQESTILNLEYGDSDSLGLFQQRPSQGWGSEAQIMDPVYASTAFYGALQDVIAVTPTWATDPLTDVAQAVQGSAYPDAYAQWEQQAADLVTEYWATAAIAPSDGVITGPPVGDCGDGAPGSADGPIIPPGLVVDTSWPAEAATEDDPTSTGLITPRTLAMYTTIEGLGYTAGGATCWDAHAWNPDSDHPLGRACDVFFAHPDPAAVAEGWALANYLVANQAQLGVAYVIWQGQYWSATSPAAWVPYTSGLYGCPDPANVTGCHYDHVHISMY